jgi:hypothetical protein
MQPRVDNLHANPAHASALAVLPGGPAARNQIALRVALLPSQVLISTPCPPPAPPQPSQAATNGASNAAAEQFNHADQLTLRREARAAQQELAAAVQDLQRDTAPERFDPLPVEDNYHVGEPMLPIDVDADDGVRVPPKDDASATWRAQDQQRIVAALVILLIILCLMLL